MYFRQENQWFERSLDDRDLHPVYVYACSLVDILDSNPSLSKLEPQELAGKDVGSTEALVAMSPSRRCMSSKHVPEFERGAIFGVAIGRS